MRLFPLEQDQNNYGPLAAQIETIYLEAIPRLFHFREKDLIVQTAMFIFHAHAKQTSYHIFDRFVYAMAALLLAGKMYDQLESAYEVVKQFRDALRRIRNREGTDALPKTLIEIKKVFEAEATLMINIGFDLNVETGMTWMKKWQKSLGEPQFYQKASKEITKMYQTTVCLYCQPEFIAMTGIHITLKGEGLTADLKAWNPSFLEYYNSSKEEMNQVYDEYTKRII